MKAADSAQRFVRRSRRGWGVECFGGRFEGGEGGLGSGGTVPWLGEDYNLTFSVFVSLYIFIHFYICLCVYAYFCVFFYIFLDFFHIKLIV